MTGLTYLGALLVSIGGLAVLDRRFRLAFWSDARRAGLALGIGVVGFVMWDAAGLVLGIFQRGDSRHMTGIELAPDLPLEEIFFLILLCYSALLVWRAGELLRGRRIAGGVSRAVDDPGERP